MLRTSLELDDIKYVAQTIDFNKLKNKTILISGGTGFIGSFFCDVIRYRNKNYGDNIKLISLSRHQYDSDDTVKYLICDINNKINIEDDIDYIIHLASNTHPKQYAEDPVGTITTNILGCNNLLELGIKKNIKRFLLASSVEIYGQCIDRPVDELYSGYIDCNNARSGYNEAKRLSESLCQSYKVQYNLDFVTARLSRIIGPDRKHDTKAIAQFMDKALAKEDIVLKSKGNQLFSYTYVSDAVEALLKILIDGACGEAYNVAADPTMDTLADYANYIASFASKKVIFELENNDSVSKASYALLDTKKLKSIGWKPRYTVREGLLRTFNIKKAIGSLNSK